MRDHADAGLGAPRDQVIALVDVRRAWRLKDNARLVARAGANRAGGRHGLTLVVLEDGRCLVRNLGVRAAARRMAGTVRRHGSRRGREEKA